MEKQTINKKGDVYYPTEDIKKNAWVSDASIYKKALEDPVLFWEGLANDINWYEKWKVPFVHNPPCFKWFVGGKTNITYNCLDLNLRERANKIAYIWEPESLNENPRTLTYRQLFDEVNKFSNALKKLGVKKGDRVAIYMPMIPEVVVSMLACARIGAVHAVVFSAFSPAALNVRLQDTQAKVLITSDGYYRRGSVINLKNNADEAILDTKVEKVVVVKRAGNDISWEEKRDIWYSEITRKESNFCPPEKMDSEDLLFILYTSGSTGKPKGCEHICGGYSVQAKFTGKWIFDLKDKDVFWSTADVGWITGHTYTVYSPLLNGITSVIFEGVPDYPEHDRWAKIIEKNKVTIFYTAPTAIRMFEKYGIDILKGDNLSSLRLLGSVGEPIDEAAWEVYFKDVGSSKCPIVDTWWQTETGGILISSLPGIGPFKPAYVGVAFPGVKFDILEGNLVLLPPFSPGVFRGIYKNPQKYLETYFTQYGNKIYCTSDSALKDENGLIRIVGRMDDVIKVAGHRITSGELEEAINAHSDIIESAVIGIPDEIKGEVPAAFVVLKNNRVQEDMERELALLVRKTIGPIASLAIVFLVKDLPKTRSGKIMRRILKKLMLKEELGDLSTLSNPEVVNEIKSIIEGKNS